MRSHNPTFPLFRISLIVFNLSLYTLLLLIGCYSTAPVIKIGLVAPFEGAQRAVGYDVIYSARLAVREVNAQGGIGGYRVALVAFDDMSDPQLARETAAALAIDPDVVAVLGHWSAETSAAAAAVYAEAGVPFLAIDAIKQDPFTLSPDFLQAYSAVTPFDKPPGVYAGPAYDAMAQVFAALETAVSQQNELNRETVGAVLVQNE